MLLTTKNEWGDHLIEIECVILRLVEAGLKGNDNKLFFGHYECEYVKFWVTRDGIQPLAKKV